VRQPLIARSEPRILTACSALHHYLPAYTYAHWPLLGIIFLPFATLIYLLLYTPGRGLSGWDWFWVALAALLDIGHWGASASQRNQVPGRRASQA
jgi:hypothetical protein